MSGLPVSALSLEEFSCESVGWEPTTPLRFQNAVIAAILFSLLPNEIVSLFIRLPLVNASRAYKEKARRGAAFVACSRRRFLYSTPLSTIWTLGTGYCIRCCFLFPTAREGPKRNVLFVSVIPWIIERLSIIHGYTSRERLSKKSARDNPER